MGVEVCRHTRFISLSPRVQSTTGIEPHGNAGVPSFYVLQNEKFMVIQAVCFAEWCKAGLRVNWPTTTAAPITVWEERFFSILCFLFKILGLRLLMVLILVPNISQKLSYDPKIKVQKQKLLLLNKFGKHHIPYPSRRLIMLINMLKGSEKSHSKGLCLTLFTLPFHTFIWQK